MEHQPPTDTQKSQRTPPPLPERLLDLAPLVYWGTGAWLVAAIALAISHYVFDATPPIWLWTALAGVFLGLIGIPIMWWQRSASRHGHRGAQRDL